MSGGPPGRLLVEGVDDQHVIEHLLQAAGWGVRQRGLVVDSGGNSWQGAIKALDGLVQSEQRLGIVLDADSDPVARWQEVVRAAAKHKITVPSSPPPTGFVGPGFLPDSRFGVYLLPAPSVVGTLEDLLLDLVPPGPVWDHAQTATLHASTLGAPFATTKTLKASLRTFLAWQEEPGVPFGRAIRVGALGSTSPAVASLLAWFTQLFAE